VQFFKHPIKVHFHFHHHLCRFLLKHSEELLPNAAAAAAAAAAALVFAYEKFYHYSYRYYYYYYWRRREQGHLQRYSREHPLALFPVSSTAAIPRRHIEAIQVAIHYFSVLAQLVLQIYYLKIDRFRLAIQFAATPAQVEPPPKKK
jgi:hypothetical protein